MLLLEACRKRHVNGEFVEALTHKRTRNPSITPNNGGFRPGGCLRILARDVHARQRRQILSPAIVVQANMPIIGHSMARVVVEVFSKTISPERVLDKPPVRLNEAWTPILQVGSSKL